MKINTLGCLGLLAISAVGTQASLTPFTSESAFQSQGSIAYNSTFTDFGTGFGFPGDPFTRGGVTYTSVNNLTWGKDTPYTTTETLIGNNYWTPILGSLGSGYNMFGFQIATYNTSPITFDITTTVGNYVFASQTIADSQAGNLDFRGFIASPGEEITGFAIIADNGQGNLAGITHVQVGNTVASNVPETSAVLPLLGLGFATLALVKRKI